MLADAPGRAEIPPRLGLCLDCNYVLRGLPTPRCPECGREFDPADPATFNPGRPVPGWAAFAVGPIRWPVYGAALGGMAIMLWRARLPGEHFGWRSPVMLGWVGLAMVWLAWPAVRRGVLAACGWPGRVIRPMWGGFWVVPVLVVGMVVATARRLPARLAFDGSLPAMNRLAREVGRDPRAPHENRWVGLYEAKNIHAIAGGVKFTAEDDNTAFKAGFVYLPRLDPKNRSLHDYAYLGRGWWSWREEG